MWKGASEIPSLRRPLAVKRSLFSKESSMRHSTTCSLAVAILVCAPAFARPEDQKPEPSKRSPSGVYAVLRDGLEGKDVLPLKDDEMLVVDRHRYVKTDE